MASLLEVGTGFHPELTGRENIFLNGAILGMSKKEIKSKFDEIVDFAGVERYIDTPVKRYSSGMYVRLAFGVAAHLEPEILIVDEVLAVGDVEFQKKALGKIKDISQGEGRTVLFVSHNILAVQKLCDKGIMLENGCVACKGNIKSTIDRYLKSSSSNQSHFINENLKEDSNILEIKVVNDQDELRSSFNFDENIRIDFLIKVARKHLGARLSFRVKDQFERNIFTSEINLEEYITRPGQFKFFANIPNSLLAPNFYQITVAIHVINKQMISFLDSPVGFEVIESGTNFIESAGKDYGCVLVECNWNYREYKNSLDNYES